MAYWRNYRKFAAETCAVVYAESSESEKINEPENCVQDVNTDSFPDPHNLENELLLSTDSSTDDENVPDYSQTQNECSPDNVKTFGEELASWATKYQVQRAAVNDLLDLLQKLLHVFAKDRHSLFCFIIIIIIIIIIF